MAAACVGCRAERAARPPEGGQMRHGDDERAGMGRLDRKHICREERAREVARLKVNISKVAEVPVYQAMAREDGRDPRGLGPRAADKTVRHEAKDGRSRRANGVTGVIGWYVPTYLVQQHPELKVWTGLKKDATLFKSPESGSQGMFLGGDPSYQQKDQTLIKALGLNLKFVSAAPSRRRSRAGSRSTNRRSPCSSTGTTRST